MERRKTTSAHLDRTRIRVGTFRFESKSDSKVPCLQLRSPDLVLRACLGYETPERGSMVGVLKVAELMNYHLQTV